MQPCCACKRNASEVDNCLGIPRLQKVNWMHEAVWICLDDCWPLLKTDKVRDVRLPWSASSLSLVERTRAAARNYAHFMRVWSHNDPIWSHMIPWRPMDQVLQLSLRTRTIPKGGPRRFCSWAALTPARVGQSREHWQTHRARCLLLDSPDLQQGYVASACSQQPAMIPGSVRDIRDMVW